MDSLISTFHIDWHLIIAQAINFAVVLLVLYFFALKPLKKLMDERGATIAGGLENAEKQKELLLQASADYEAKMAEANIQAVAKMKEVKGEMQALREKEMEKIQAELAGALAANKKQIDAEKQKAMDEIRKEAVTLVIAVAEKVLGEAATGKVESKLVEESIKNI